ncbi:MAG TPA: conjugal transfer protein [Brevundimonas sp.]
MDARPEGWRQPVAGALTTPATLAGMPRDYAVLMGTRSSWGWPLRIWWLGLLWWAAACAVGLWAARIDNLFLAVLRRHLSLPGHLDA